MQKALIFLTTFTKTFHILLIVLTQSLSLRSSQSMKEADGKGFGEESTQEVALNCL